MSHVVFLDPAEEEMLEAFAYYEMQAVGLGDDFLAEVEYAVRWIAQYPESGTAIRGKIRRRLLRRFPVGILYRVDPDAIVIVAVMHLRRRPDYWKDRT